MNERLANIIEFPRTLRAERMDIAPETSLEIQLAQLTITLESWRQILRQLDRFAELNGAGLQGEQSRQIRQLIADAEHAIASVQRRHS
ncbi:hypothetical protein SSBR45G_34090 [Bradyrhizobium sp. SSBR45G]|uniref:hypothetical protein n=1 Tax=unclassified Bradyrhizobium TaxID=2631580 RepID=UPI002342AFCB|nr:MULTISPECIES: hypothetical protein [unclassified Bradyrhizobium]GLH78500.1 hypothetical protein SSBR45G_34090 [Bradyrhizobium sp. SSBR45G]GLH86284.1 hypothetical protein SSBR45R_37440 [Bradyrhizobium sp. SSBR45R]